MENNILLECKNLTHSFDYLLFEDINLSVVEKEKIAIIGHSGCGKSTLLNILSSLLKPNQGTVYFKENDIFKLNEKDFTELRRNDFGIIFQSHYLLRGFSAEENLQVAELLSGNKIDNKILNTLNIEHVMSQSVGELSGGQQQRLSCCRILTKKPKIIFADEPTGNLDYKTASDVINSLFSYVENNNSGLILVTHEEDIAFKCDKVYKLEEFKLKQLK